MICCVADESQLFHTMKSLLHKCLLNAPIFLLKIQIAQKNAQMSTF